MGKGKTVREMGGGGEVRDKPVSTPPELREGLEKLTIKGHWRRPAGYGRVSLYGSMPMDELGLRD